jgi:hypothetical protein
MISKTHPDTLATKMAELKKEGFTTDFKFRNEKIYSYDESRSYKSSDIQILKTFRFEGESNPDDAAILYAIECKPTGEKGLIADSYGASSDTGLEDFMNHT